MPTLEEHQRAFHNAKLAGDDEAAASIMQDIFQAEKAASLKRAAEDSGPVERGLANLGAGYDAAWQGLKQITPGFKSPSDADIREKRTRDTALAKATELGVGADWMPSYGSALQVAGEVAPTLAIPGVGAAGNAAAKLASKALPRASEAALAWARASGVGGAGGAVAGALEPTLSDESRAVNTAAGAAGGLVLPAAGAAVKAGKALWGTVSRAGGTERAGRVLRQALGGEADDVASAVDRREQQRRFQPRSVREIPETLSEATGSPNAARMESASRRAGETADTWDDLVREQNARRFGAIEDATREAGALDTRAASRDRVTEPLRERALGEAGADPWFHFPALQAAEAVASGPTGVNPAVQRVADFVRKQFGPESQVAMTPERLYEVRKVLADKLHGPHIIGDELSAATKGANRETLRLIDGIDEALNTASGGKWQGYLDRYQDKSRPVNASRAARDARAVFSEPGIPEIGGAPEVTLNRLRAAQNAGQSSFDPRRTDFSPKATRTLQAVEDQYVRAQEPARVRKLVGTQGGGSQTSTDVDAALSQLVSRSNIPVISAVVEHLTRGSNLAARTELSRLLQNPTAAAAAIRHAAASGKPLSDAQRLLLEASARSLAGTAIGATSAQ